MSQTPTPVALVRPASTQATLGGAGVLSKVSQAAGGWPAAVATHSGPAEAKKERGVLTTVPGRAPRSRGHGPSLMNKSGMTYFSFEHTGGIY